MKDLIWSTIILMCVQGHVCAQDNTFDQPDKNFDGLYLTVSVGTQNIFGGAFIDDLDLLAQKNGFVLEFSPGLRTQVLNDRLVLGVEFQLGLTDGDVSTSDPRYGFRVDYENNFQHGFGFTAGTVLGANRNWHLFTYARLTNRQFDIMFTEDTGFTHTQEDGQRFVRYGLGLERSVTDQFHLNLTAGKVYTDFGNLVTSQGVQDGLDANLGMVWQF